MAFFQSAVGVLQTLVIAQSAGLINGSTAIDASTLAAMQTTLEC